MAWDIDTLHRAVGAMYGKKKTCGEKVKYNTRETADKAAVEMNAKESTRKELEAYPCPFCDKFHLGRKMSELELIETLAWVFGEAIEWRCLICDGECYSPQDMARDCYGLVCKHCYSKRI